MDNAYTDRTWQSADGLTLHFRDYRGAGDGRPPVLCLHGLTRNARDFERLAAHISSQGWRVVVPDMRGRGESEYAPNSDSYVVPTYIADVLALLEQEGIDRFVSIGTSMGGLMTLGLATIAPERLAAVALNDIGPEVDTAGLEKIKSYVGQGRSFPTWMHAARELEELHAEAYPSFGTSDWIAMAKRTLTLCSNGRIAFDYDMKIAEPIMAADAAAVPPDLWPGFDAIADKPLLLIRGALSNILSQATFEAMQRHAPDAHAVVIRDTGHAPTLDEPDAVSAIDSLLARVK